MIILAKDDFHASSERRIEVVAGGGAERGRQGLWIQARFVQEAHTARPYKHSENVGSVRGKDTHACIKEIRRESGGKREQRRSYAKKEAKSGKCKRVQEIETDRRATYARARKKAMDSTPIIVRAKTKLYRKTSERRQVQEIGTERKATDVPP